jgi:hypothetical protein
VREANTFVTELSRRGAKVILEAPKPVFKSPPFRSSDWFNKHLRSVPQVSQYRERISMTAAQLLFWLSRPSRHKQRAFPSGIRRQKYVIKRLATLSMETDRCFLKEITSAATATMPFTLASTTT